MHIKRTRIAPLFAALLVGFALVGAGCAPASLPTPVNENPNPAPAAGPKFGESFSLNEGTKATLDDGLVVELVKINDSRCKEGVQCIWAGELSPELSLSGGALAEPKTLRLGTTTAKSGTVGLYTVTLDDASTSAIKITVTKGTVVIGIPVHPKIHPKSPEANASVTSPLVVSGDARGNWYFEASFPIKLLDANGATVAEGHAEAKGDWMTNDFVPYEGNLVWTAAPATSTGTLVLEKDNPSGLPENDDSVRYTVRFGAGTGVGQCFTGGCSGEICSDEQGAISNCVYRPEYACYKDAKCERQANGKCGFTPSPTLQQCLKDAPAGLKDAPQ